MRGLREDIEELNNNIIDLHDKVVGHSQDLESNRRFISSFYNIINNEDFAKHVRRLDEMIRMMQGAVQSVEAERMTVNALRSQVQANSAEMSKVLAKLVDEIDKLKKERKKKSRVVKAVDKK